MLTGRTRLLLSAFTLTLAATLYSGDVSAPIRGFDSASQATELKWEEAARAVPAIHERLLAQGCTVPIVGDFHFNGHKLLAQVPECAQALAKYRINPGNVGQGSRRDEQFSQMIEAACRFGKPVRIGVNWGSLDPALARRMMDDNAKLAQPLDASEVIREALIVSALDSAAPYPNGRG